MNVIFELYHKRWGRGKIAVVCNPLRLDKAESPWETANTSARSASVLSCKEPASNETRLRLPKE